MPRTRNIWIFGGTGFIGSALVRHLSSDKENRIHMLVHKRVDYPLLEGLNIFTGSLADFDRFWFERYPPDILFHLARPAGRNILTRTLRSSAGEKANRHLVNIIKHLPKPPVVVYVSGSLMYGNRTIDNPALENSSLAPESFAKYYFRNELPWLETQQKGILDVRFARPGWILGPGSWFREFFWEPYLRTGKVPCYGDGDHPMSLIHIDDCAAMINALSRYRAKGINLNIFTGNIILHKDFCKLVAKLLGTETEMIPYPDILRKYGATTARALISSTPMKTLYPELHEIPEKQFRDTEPLLRDVISLLENV